MVAAVGELRTVLAMASIEGIKRRIKEYRPHIQSAFVVYAAPRKTEEPAETEFEIVQVTDPDDPLLEKISAKWQRPMARESMAKGEILILVALKDGEPVGRIWQLSASERRLTSGIPRVRLGPKEKFMFDLFVEREYRRSNIGAAMAEYFYRMYDIDLDNLDYAYGFISYENAGSILWHWSVGFNIAQTFNYLSIGPRIKWKIPFSDVPRFGPMSRKGRHNDPDQKMFGTSLFPNI